MNKVQTNTKRILYPDWNIMVSKTHDDILFLDRFAIKYSYDICLTSEGIEVVFETWS